MEYQTDDKAQLDNLERAPEVKDEPASLENGLAIDARQLYRKIDIRIVPWLTFLYLLAFVSNNANITSLAR